MTTDTPSGQTPTESATLVTTDPGTESPAPAQTPAVVKPPVEGQAVDDSATHAKSDEAATTDASATAKTGAPEKYEPFTALEGVTLSEESVTELQGIAKELNLTQAQAQKLADLVAKTEAQYGPQQNLAKLNEAGAEWEKQVKADKAIGGKKLKENLAVAKKALDEYGTPALKKMLDETRFGNHPEVVRFMLKVGEAMSEDTVLTGSRQQPGNNQDHAKILYPNQA